MLKNESIICFSSIDWDFIWQGHQEIMTRFAREGNQVLFIENTGVRAPMLKDLGRIKKRFFNWKKGVGGIRKIEDNLYVYSPLVLPFPYSRPARYVNKKILLGTVRRWMRAMKVRSPICWTFLPTALIREIVDEIDYRALVYYCIDSFIASSPGARKIASDERRMIEKADLVFVTSLELGRYCSQYSSRVHSFPFGVNLENFERVSAARAADTPADLATLKRPVIGYVGGLHKWVDYDLVAYLAKENPGMSFAMVGPEQTDVSKLKRLANVFLLGQRSQQDVPRYVKAFDVCLIPYVIADYTINVYPTKMNEYLVMGKAVISTDLPEVREYNRTHGNVVSIASDRKAFDAMLKAAAGAQEPSSVVAERIAQAKRNSWASKVGEMSRLVEGVIAERAAGSQLDWKGSLKRIYKGTKRGLLKAALAALVVYVAVFASGLGWYLGRPLAACDAPAKADVIIVLGGGVGESGKAGQGYEERVTKAAELYRNKYAGKIIFSTGYRYLLKEAEVMAALALSLGVRQADIIIDDKPVNTYESIVSAGAILSGHGWSKALIVTSKYHALRVKLVAAKNTPNINVLCIPTQSGYYAGRFSMRHLAGFLHEYAAIIYYKFKSLI